MARGSEELHLKVVQVPVEFGWCQHCCTVGSCQNRMLIQVEIRTYIEGRCVREFGKRREKGELVVYMRLRLQVPRGTRRHVFKCSCCVACYTTHPSMLVH